MQNELSNDDSVVWVPTEEQIASSNLTVFMNKHLIKSYEQLLEKSVTDPEWFYPSILEELGIPWIKPYEKVLDVSNGKELPLWFKGGETNAYLYGLEKHSKAGNGSQLALIWEGEDGTTQSFTFQQIKEETDRLAVALRKLGVKKGDRVGVFLPQIPQIQPILFACAKIGAVVIPCFSGFGAEAVAVRLQDASAKWLFTADGFSRKGKVIEMMNIAIEAAEQAQSIEKIIVIDHQRKFDNEETENNEKVIPYSELLRTVLPHESVKVEPMKSDEPFLIIYTSGTTGKPKGTQHTHYSFPLKNAIDMYFCFDVKNGDRMFWLTDLGWMMGPWHLFGTAILGATAVMYEGSPDYPNEHRLWELIDKHQVTIFGIAPTVIRSLMKVDDEPRADHDLSSLRILGSTGEAWNPKPWLWYWEKVGGKTCPIINYSGGTEISGGILSVVPIKPLKPCSFHGPAPGMAASVVDGAGNPVSQEVGDLVITEPFLGMTYSFWQDHERYLNTYWRTWPGVWHHGDFAEIDEEGFWYILGRSDDTMNIAGKRLGPADIESVVASHSSVKESAVIGIPDEVKGEVPVLFIVPNDTMINETAIVSECRQMIADKLSKAFLPKHIYLVDTLPRTQSGKVARRVIRSTYLGMTTGDLSTLQDPHALQQFKR